MKSALITRYLILVLLCGIPGINTMIDSVQVQKVAKNIEVKLKNLFNSVTHAHRLREDFERLHEEQQIVVKNLNVSDVSDEFNNNLKDLLLSNMLTVKNIKQKAKELYNNYTPDPNIKPFDYFNDKDASPNAMKEEVTFFHGINLNINRSHVRLPANIYKYQKSILNDAMWSQGLDERFLENYKRTPQLLWQYFGSETGMLRTFPGSRQDPKVLDTYDCRRRLWYSQAINSPKDVLIVLDQSGSMTGSNFNIAKLTVKSLIDTLQQDDFFNVVTFRQKTEFLIPCIKNLRQASSKNKNAFKASVDLLPSPGGVSDVKVALRHAFHILKVKNTDNINSSNCTKVLLLISDGIDGDSSIADEADRLNVDKDVIIFSYIIGLGTHVEIMKSIACRNGGESYLFPTVGTVWTGVLEYQHKLSRPVAQTNDELVIFTPLYLDSSGFGMMTTVSVGVFTNKTSKFGIPTLIGVAGVDIRMTMIEQQYPKAKLGVFGHAFSINNNGLFLIHPRLKELSNNIKDHATVYLDDLEHTINHSKSEYIKTAMIDGKSGCIDAELDWLYFKPDNRRVIRFDAKYCYASTEGTPFISGVSIPQANSKYVESNPPTSDLSLKQSIDSLGSGINRTVEIANWIFCDIASEAQKTQPASLKIYPTAFELKIYLEKYYYSNSSLETFNQLPEQCLNETLWPLLLSAKTISNFKNTFLNKSVLKLHHADNVYAISAPGYISAFPKSPKRPINRDIHVEQRYSHPAAFHIQGTANTIVFTTLVRHGEPKKISIADEEMTSIGTVLAVSSGNVLTTVIGMDISTSYLKEVLENASKSFKYKCNETSCISHNCQDVDNLKCYLIDENAYVVVSNRVRVSEHGYFFGYVNGLIMEQLEALNIYKKHEFIDYQAECEEEIESTTSNNAIRLQSVLDNSIRVVMFIFYQIIAFVSIFSSILIPKYTAANTVLIKNVSCSKTTIIHTLQNHTSSYSGTLACSKVCEQSFSIEVINGTNLVLIMVTDNCVDSLICTHFIYHNKPVKNMDVDTCNETLRYRKAYPLCYRSMTYHSPGSDGSKIYHLTVVLILPLLLCFILGIT